MSQHRETNPKNIRTWVIIRMCIDRTYPHMRILLHYVFNGVRIGFKQMINALVTQDFNNMGTITIGLISNCCIFVDVRYT